MPRLSRSALRLAIHGTYLLSLAGSARRFRRATRHPEAFQLEKLKRFLAANAETAYGRAHGFSGCSSLAEFQRRVPITDYDALEPWVLRATSGESHVLTREPIRLFERSGGSTSANKLIPYTASLLQEFSAATEAWIFDIYRSFPHLLGTRSYWSISPAARTRDRTPGGHPIGIDDDAEYFGPVGRWALAQLMAVPSSVVHASDMESWRRQTAQHLLATPDLGLVSVWHPSFLSLLLEYISKNWSALLALLPAVRACALEPAYREGRVHWEEVWPTLGFLSCWTDAGAADFVPPLQSAFPKAFLQGKGLLATEGVVSVPLCGRPGGVVAVSSHFLEFLDLDAPHRKPLLPHELREGGAYSPLLTTAGGFCRYHLKDAVRCVGFEAATPLIRFLGKQDATSDLCGEKLTTGLVESAIDEARQETGLEPRFAMLAPGRNPPRYVLFLETPAAEALISAFGEAVERALLASQHYRYCRELGQLGNLEVRSVREGLVQWQRALIARGARLGTLKFLALDSRCEWEHVLE